MVQINNNERIELVSNFVDLQDRPSSIQNLIKTLLEKDGNIDLDAHKVYELYHYTINLGAEENQKRERVLEILNTKLDLLFEDVPKFFRDAFENQKLYSCYDIYKKIEKDENRSQEKDKGSPFHFLKDNILLPIYHKDQGVVKCDELEQVIRKRYGKQDNNYPTIEERVSEEIGKINRSKDFGVLYAKQEEQKLPFFELLKSMINPELTQNEKYNYELLTSAVNSKLESEQSHFRAVQLKANKDLGAQDHRLGIDWNGNNDTDTTNKSLFSHVHPACLSEKEDYKKLGIIIESENGDKELLHDFVDKYLKKIKSRHHIVNISNANEANSIAEFYSHIFLAEDRQDTNSHSEQKEHARLKLECKAPKHVFNINCDQNFFIRMAFEATEEPYVYKMTKEGRNEYHHNMMFRESSFKDGDYIYAADNTIEVTEMTESTYQQAGICRRVIENADQKSYLTMTMHLVPISRRSQTSGVQTDGHYETTNSRLIPRGTIGIGNEGDLECDGQSSHSRIDIKSNPDAQGLREDQLKTDSFKIQSINFDRVSALVANKELYQISARSEQPVKDCVQAMQEKMNRIRGKVNNLSNTPRPSAPPQSLCSTRPVSALVGATGGIRSPQHLNFSNADQHLDNINLCLEESWIIPKTPSPTSHPSRPSSLINNLSANLYPNLSDLRSPEENDESFTMITPAGSPSSSLSSSIEVLEFDNKRSNIRR